MNLRLLLKLLLVGLLIFLIFLFGSRAWKDYQVELDQKRMEAMYSQILDGSSTQPTSVTIDYQKQIAKGSPLIFGGNHSPSIDHNQAWDAISEVGVTSIRKDLFIEIALPWNITLDEYKKNVNNMQSVENWNWNEINKIKNSFKYAKKRNMKTVAIMSYSPHWLTYSDKTSGVPKDWAIYEGLVKKTYKIYRDEIDYLEIWNEPNWKTSLSVEKSGLTPEEAYKEIYYHASKAIREVDNEINDGKIIPLGGSVGSTPHETSILEKLVSDNKTKEKIDFVSYHNYDSFNKPEPSWFYYKDVLNRHGKGNLPVYLTEWNAESDSMTYSLLNTSDMAISYTGYKLVEFLKMGLVIANYHTLDPLNLKRPNEGEGYMGFYRWKNGKAELLPQAKTWRLMSKQMKLGKGESQIYEMNTNDKELNGVGFKNVEGHYGFVVTNNGDDSKLTTINLAGLYIGSYAKAEIYYASADNDASAPIFSGEIKGNDKEMKLQVYAPKKSVVGVILTANKQWYDF